MRPIGDPYGTHRVLQSKGDLPQGAERLDPSLPIFSNEILIEVDRLNVDSTSFKQLWEVSLHDTELLKKRVMEIVRERGKLHNPITQSGGMLIGSVKEVGAEYRGTLQFQKGDRVATLVSLTLTPLHLEKILEVDSSTGQLKAQGHAILFETGIASRLPLDLPEPIALAVLDVCGAPALVLRHSKKGDRVLFIGGGKSARLSAAALRGEWGSEVSIDCVDVDLKALEEMRLLELADEVYGANATEAGSYVNSPLSKKQYDLVVNVANVPGTEVFSIMAVKEGGKVIFFGMGTSFTKVALGAEGIGKDAAFLIGSGYAQGHAELALDLVRRHKGLREWFERKYGV
ncbi:MAG: L-erythro-3,5-diaminohexanoate dehydrogenase [bacterium]